MAAPLGYTEPKPRGVLWALSGLALFLRKFLSPQVGDQTALLKLSLQQCGSEFINTYRVTCL
ncbi:hypothetical protein [Bradyrhizobium sp. JYMT SZCCT0428]|uniref:hypothetical protein n=1 Tax=Bradyrhizobium sp. JYMT SZCCT0428 TaxID=2807673 RepID=UPI001BA719E4|nr:hypothetical protein [Bradyrhizobium sp. JYMT SZCCT0428]MBR1153706.1 hypothetical protein [Bradyrhizobium sp. JYMT SZCCT0428]